jgi:hypothetical protein
LGSLAAAEELGLAGGQRAQQGTAAILLGLGHLVGEPGRGGAPARRILEHVHAGQRQRLDQAVALVKQAHVLAGEAHHDVDSDGNAGDVGDGALHQLRVPLCRVLAAHGQQDGRAAALQWKVQVTAEARVTPQGEEVAVHVLRLDRADADTCLARAL